MTNATKEHNNEGALPLTPARRRELERDWDNIAHFVANLAADLFIDEAARCQELSTDDEIWPLINGLGHYYLAASLLAADTDHCFGDMVDARRRKGSRAVIKIRRRAGMEQEQV